MKKVLLELSWFDKFLRSQESHAGQNEFHRYSTQAISIIETIATQLDSTISQVLIAVFAVLIHRYFGQQKILLVARINNCEVVTYECDFTPNPTFSSFLAKLSPDFISATSTVLFNSLSFKFEIKIIKRKLLFSIYHEVSVITERNSMNVAKHYELLLKQLARNSDARIGELIMVTAEEKRLLKEWSRTKQKYIGKTAFNTRFHVLDQYHQLCPIGVPGELYIISDNISCSTKLYKTGEIVRYLDDGNLEWLGTA